MEATDTNQEAIESINRLIFRQVARSCDDESQSVKLKDLLKSLKNGEGLTAEKATEIKKAIKSEADLKRYLEKLEAQNKLMYIEKDGMIMML